MNFLLGLIIWFVQLLFLITMAILKSIGNIVIVLLNIFGMHLSENKERGKVFVKAYYFIQQVDDFGEDVEDANRTASTLFESWSDPDVDHRIILRAIRFSKEYYGGKQLPVIAEARTKGFIG